jgi:DNA-directed RNA polymerase specialized sigma24 family protein
MLARLNTGDLTACDEILGHCQERFRCQVHRMLGQYPRLRHREQTDDVLSELYLRMRKTLAATRVRTLPELLGLSSQHIRWALLTLIRIHYPSGGAGGNPVTLTGEGDPTPDWPDPKAVKPDSATWLDFHEAIDRLAPEARLLFDLHFYQGLTLEEIATGVLKVSPRTVKRRWGKVRRFLGKILLGEEGSEN